MVSVLEGGGSLLNVQQPYKRNLKKTFLYSLPTSDFQYIPFYKSLDFSYQTLILPPEKFQVYNFNCGHLKGEGGQYNVIYPVQCLCVSVAGYN